MKVETYEVEEIQGELGQMAADAEALELIQQLGLSGQQSISNPDTATRQPYRRMTQLEQNVFTVLFPTRTPVRDYRSGLIPLRVLQVIAHAQDCGLFKRLEIWHPKDAREKDPVLVGVGTNSQYTWQEELYTLARWGEPFLTLEAMAEKAKAIWLKVTKGKLLAVQNKVSGDLSRLESIASNGFDLGEDLETLTYNA